MCFLCHLSKYWVFSFLSSLELSDTSLNFLFEVTFFTHVSSVSWSDVELHLGWPSSILTSFCFKSTWLLWRPLDGRKVSASTFTSGKFCSHGSSCISVSTYELSETTEVLGELLQDSMLRQGILCWLDECWETTLPPNDLLTCQTNLKKTMNIASFFVSWIHLGCWKKLK